MLTARTPVRSVPRTQLATSAMSAVCMCTSRVAGSEMAGNLSTESSASPGTRAAPGGSAAIPHTCAGPAAARSTARCAASAISARATSGCRFAAPNLVNDSLTTTCSASGRK
jgi:hypothetical protein